MKLQNTDTTNRLNTLNQIKNMGANRERGISDLNRKKKHSMLSIKKI